MSLTFIDANPAFRVYDVDPDTYEIMDSRTFMGEANFPKNSTLRYPDVSYFRGYVRSLVPDLS